MNRKTQGRRLIEALKRREHTYMQMLAHGVSVCPWKRIEESLRDDECVKKGKTREGLVTWRVVQATRWTA